MKLRLLIYIIFSILVLSYARKRSSSKNNKNIQDHIKEVKVKKEKDVEVEKENKSEFNYSNEEENKKNEKINAENPKEMRHLEETIQSSLPVVEENINSYESNKPINTRSEETVKINTNSNEIPTFSDESEIPSDPTIVQPLSEDAKPESLEQIDETPVENIINDSEKRVEQEETKPTTMEEQEQQIVEPIIEEVKQEVVEEIRPSNEEQQIELKPVNEEIIPIAKEETKSVAEEESVNEPIVEQGMIEKENPVAEEKRQEIIETKPEVVIEETKTTNISNEEKQNTTDEVKTIDANYDERKIEQDNVTHTEQKTEKSFEQAFKNKESNTSKYFNQFLNLITVIHKQIKTYIPYPYDLIIFFCIGYYLAKILSLLTFSKPKLVIPQDDSDIIVQNVEKKIKELSSSLTSTLKTINHTTPQPTKSSDADDKKIENKIDETQKKLSLAKESLNNEYTQCKKILDEICGTQAEIITKMP